MVAVVMLEAMATPNPQKSGMLADCHAEDNLHFRHSFGHFCKQRPTAVPAQPAPRQLQMPRGNFATPAGGLACSCSVRIGSSAAPRPQVDRGPSACANAAVLLVAVVTCVAWCSRALCAGVPVPGIARPEWRALVMHQAIRS